MEISRENLTPENKGVKISKETTSCLWISWISSPKNTKHKDLWLGQSHCGVPNHWRIFWRIIPVCKFSWVATPKVNFIFHYKYINPLKVSFSSYGFPPATWFREISEVACRWCERCWYNSSAIGWFVIVVIGQYSLSTFLLNYTAKIICFITKLK